MTKSTSVDRQENQMTRDSPDPETDRSGAGSNPRSTYPVQFTYRGQPYEAELTIEEERGLAAVFARYGQLAKAREDL